MSNLSPKSTLEDLFAHVMPEEGVQAMPVALSKAGDDKAKLMILIVGENKTASVIMANLMSVVQEMYDLAAQKEAAEELEAVEKVMSNDDAGNSD